MTRSRASLACAAVASLALLGAAPPHQLPPCVHSAFEGITQTLPDGTVIGTPDARDWGCADRGPGAAPGATARTAPARARSATADEGVTVTGIPVGPPPSFCMQPASPNPASGATRLHFALPTATHVTLSVYGRSQGHGPRETVVVRELMDADLQAGQYEVVWDLKDDHGQPLSPGIYRAVLVAGDEALCGDVEIQ
jgi:hypothetical protein